MISQETVERVREAADIVEIIGEHVRLRRMGNTWRGPCPFHQGKNPNFSVSPQKGFYHCFKCGVSGDVFTFLREHVGLSFSDAIRQVAERVGIEVREESRARQQDDPREPLREAIGAAIEWYANHLLREAVGREAREYLRGRGISGEVAERFELGFAPGDSAALLGHLHALGMDDERLLAAGLLFRREGETSVRPRFRSRLMFPIRDALGRAAGFGGRLLGPGEPKYLNSPESDVFSKRHLLYGLHMARQAIRKEERVLVVEGYLDVIRVSEAGIGAVVAPLGTALTTEQAERLARLTGNVFLLYDSDEAGQKATFRTGLELLRLGVAPRVVTLPDGEDPDSYVRVHGADGLEKQLAAGVDIFERQLQMLERRGWFADLHRARRAIDKLLPTIRAAADPVTRELYLASLSERSGVDRELLAREAEQEPRRTGMVSRGSGTDTASSDSSGRPNQSRRVEEQGSGPASGFERRGFRERRWRDRRREAEWQSDRSRPRGAATPGERAERYIALAMLHLPPQRARVLHQVSEEEFRSPVYAELFSLLSTLEGPADPELLAEQLSDQAVAELERLLESADELVSPNRLVDDSVTQLRYRALRDQSLEVQRMLLEETRQDRKDLLLAEKIRIRDEILALRGRGDRPGQPQSRAAEPREEEVT